MDEDLLVLLQPGVHLVESYFDKIFEVTFVVDGNRRFSSAFPYNEVVRRGRITLLWVP